MSQNIYVLISQEHESAAEWMNLNHYHSQFRKNDILQICHFSEIESDNVLDTLNTFCFGVLDGRQILINLIKSRVIILPYYEFTSNSFSMAC